jgi:argininosuccinate synthase
MKSREEEIEYAAAHSIPITVSKEKPYSYDHNLWGISVECGALEDPWNAPPENAYLWTVSPEKAPDKPEEVEITFTKGIPTGLNGKAMPTMKIIDSLNKVGGKHGVGRVDQVENRLVGIKSREVYEAPAAVMLHSALRAIEALVWSRDLVHFKGVLSERYSRLIYDGQWFTGLREAIDGYFDKAHEVTTGTVRLKLYKGLAVVTGRKSNLALYDKNLATYTPEDKFDHTAAEGFIKIWSLPMKGEARQKKLK